MRLSPTNPYNDIADGNPAETFSTAVSELNRFGLSYLHVVEPGATDTVAAGAVPDIRFFRKLWRGALIANKGYDLARANAVLRDGCADLVSFAALFLANPDLPERLPPRRSVQPAGSQDVLRRRCRGLYRLSTAWRPAHLIFISNINILFKTDVL